MLTTVGIAMTEKDEASTSPGVSTTLIKTKFATMLITAMTMKAMRPHACPRIIAMSATSMATNVMQETMSSDLVVSVHCTLIWSYSGAVRSVMACPMGASEKSKPMIRATIAMTKGAGRAGFPDHVYGTAEANMRER